MWWQMRCSHFHTSFDSAEDWSSKTTVFPITANEKAQWLLVFMTLSKWKRCSVIMQHVVCAHFISYLLLYDAQYILFLCVSFLIVPTLKCALFRGLFHFLTLAFICFLAHKNEGWMVKTYHTA